MEKMLSDVVENTLFKLNHFFSFNLAHVKRGSRVTDRVSPPLPLSRLLVGVFSSRNQSYAIAAHTVSHRQITGTVDTDFIY